MFSFFKKPKLPTTIFVIASFVALLLFICFFLTLRATFYNNLLAQYQPGQKYFIKKDLNTKDDPMMTKKKDLKDILAGPIISYRDPSLGNIDSPVTIVEFSDFKCDYCIEQEKELKNILAKYQDKVRLIWKDYPEADMATESFQAAKAARCADQQGKFWAYHDLLFANNSKFNKDIFYQIAKTIDLDTDSFDKCFKGKGVENLINDNMAEANILDINGIPFLYVNDQEIMGNITGDDLDRIIKLELSKAGGNTKKN